MTDEDKTTEQLRAEVVALRQQLEQQTSAVFGATFELNSYLTMIIGYSDLLHRDLSEMTFQNQEEVIQQLKIISEAGYRAADVVRQLRETFQTDPE